MTKADLVPDTGEIDPAAFRAAMRELAGGVAAITIGSGDAATGFTATSVTSLCATPPRLLVSLSRASSSWAALEKAGSFAVNLLGEGDRAIADRLAGRDGAKGAERLAGATWRTLATGSPVLDQALAGLDCEVEEALPRYDHVIVIGRVRAIELPAKGLPLVYWDGDYHPFRSGLPLTDRP